MYINMTPKGETEGVLVFVIPAAQRCMVLNGVHRDARHQGQQWTMALTQEKFWWPMIAEDCRAIVRGCLRVRGRSAKGSPVSDLSVCSAGACASQLHQHRVHDGVE